MNDSTPDSTIPVAANREALDGSRPRVRDALRDSPVVIATLDRELCFVDVNEAFARVREREGPELIGLSVKEVSPQVWATLEPVLRRVLAGETIANVMFREAPSRDAAARRDWLSSFHPVREGDVVVGVTCVANDVTNLTAAERALRLRYDLFAMLSPTTRATTDVRTANQLFGRVCEIAVTSGRVDLAWIGQVRGDEFSPVAPHGADSAPASLNVLHLDVLANDSRGLVTSALTTGDSFVDNDLLTRALVAPWRENLVRAGFASMASFPIIRSEAASAVLFVYSRQRHYFTPEIVDVLQAITPIVAYVLDRYDNDERQRSNQLELDQRDRAIAAISQGIVITDPSRTDNPIVYASPSFLRLTGYDSEEVVGQNCRILQGPSTDARTVAEVRSAIRSGDHCSVEILNYRKDGVAFWNHLEMNPIFGVDGRVESFVGVQTDVTARRELEEQLRQSQKMEAVGTLAAGVAHDINNMLLVIRGYNELVGKRVEHEDVIEMTRHIDDAVRQAADVTRRLIAFSRQQTSVAEPVDLNHLVTDTMWLWRPMLGVSITFDTELEGDLRPVVIDRGEMEQVLVNLITNACDAMPHGGRLSIRTSSVLLDEKYAALHDGVRAGLHSVIEVSDTGSGIDERTRARIFEPFFTTKAHGSGLGLATVYGIVRQAGGHISVSSEVGRGTTFALHFRVSSITVPPPVRRDVSSRRDGFETILVAEDVDDARRLLAGALQKSGYTVLQVSDGAEALALCAEYSGPIHVLITDMAMPHVNGRDVALQLLADRPNLKVIFTSGFPSGSIVDEATFASRSAFVSKPYLVDQLILEVRRLLA